MYLAVYPGDISGTGTVCTYSAYSAASVSLVVRETSWCLADDDDDDCFC